MFASKYWNSNVAFFCFILTSLRFHSIRLRASSSLYPVYPTHKKLWSESGEGRKTATHTHRGECGQRVPQLEKGVQRERNRQLTNIINGIRTNN